MRRSGPLPEAFDAVVLAGGAGRRMGQDKPGLYVGRLPLLDRVLGAVSAARTVVVVGPRRDVTAPVVWAREDPPGAGPVAALAAGLAQVTAPHVVLLAADLPFVTAGTVQALRESLAPAVDGAVLLDGQGREQYLLSAWRTSALRHADLTVDRLGLVLAQLRYAPVGLDVLPGSPEPWFDCDTPGDLREARRRA